MFSFMDVQLTIALQVIKALFSRFDKDGNGSINLDEFLETLRVSKLIVILVT